MTRKFFFIIARIKKSKFWSHMKSHHLVHSFWICYMKTMHALTY